MESIHGNSCIYYMFQVANILMFLVGLGTLAIGIYVCIVGGGFIWYNGTFVILGIVIIFSGLVGWKAKYSLFRLSVYCLSIAGSFFVEAGFTIAVIAYGHFESIVDGTNNANIVRFTLIGFCGVLLICLVSAWLYRRSLSGRRSMQVTPYKPLRDPETSQPKEEYKSKYEEIKTRRNNT